MNEQRKINWIDRLVRPLRVIAYTQAQFDRFLKSHGIPPRLAVRVTRESDFDGLATDQPMLKLPHWHHAKSDVHVGLARWRQRGGKTLDISERVAIGRLPLCPNDTDGDGDCHLCVNKMSCQWLVPEKK